MCMSLNIVVAVSTGNISVSVCRVSVSNSGNMSVSVCKVLLLECGYFTIRMFTPVQYYAQANLTS